MKDVFAFNSFFDFSTRSPMPFADGVLEQAESSRDPASALPFPPDEECGEKTPPDRSSTPETVRDPEFEPPKDWELSKHDKGWRKVVRNFTPS